jgi:segregation and condensation protein B
MSLKAKVEAIIYAAEEPITLEQISLLLKDTVLADLASAKENAAIEQADSAAEALAAAPEAAPETQGIETAAGGSEAQDTKATPDVAAEESALLPELAIESAEEICPEPGPLMPQDVPSKPEASSEGGPRPSAFGESGELPNPAPEGEPEPAPAESASVTAPEATSRKRQPKKTEQEIAEEKAVRTRVREILVELITDYSNEDRGMEIRQVAGGFRMATKPEHHDVVRAFAKSLKPPIRLSLAALETLAVIAYKQPITGPEIADIRGVESASVLGTLLDRKLITTAGRKQVIGRPMQYKTSKDFLLRFGLNDVNELPSMEEFSQLGSIEIAPPEQQETQSLFESSTSQSNTEVDVEPDPSEPEASESESSEPESAEASQSDTPGEAGELDTSSTPEQQSEVLESQDQGSPLPESQPPDAAETADSQPQSEAESSSTPEAEHPIGH